MQNNRQRLAADSEPEPRLPWTLRETGSKVKIKRDTRIGYRLEASHG